MFGLFGVVPITSVAVGVGWFGILPSSVDELSSLRVSIDLGILAIIGRNLVGEFGLCFLPLVKAVDAVVQGGEYTWSRWTCGLLV